VADKASGHGGFTHCTSQGCGADWNLWWLDRVRGAAGMAFQWVPRLGWLGCLPPVFWRPRALCRCSCSSSGSYGHLDVLTAAKTPENGCSMFTS